MTIVLWRHGLALALTPVLATAALLGLVAVSRGSDSETAMTAEPWPPFVMVYRVTEERPGLNGATRWEVFRLDYADRRHHETTLLENPAAPHAAGSVWSYDGRTSMFRDHQHNWTRIQRYAPDAPQVVPEEWLIPRKVPPLAELRGARVRLGWNGLATAIHEETIFDGLGALRAPGFPGSTASGLAERQSRQEITYRQSDGIPVHLVETLDGREVRRVEVLELQLRTS